MDDYGKYRMVSSIKVNRSSRKPSEEHNSKVSWKQELLSWIGFIGIITVIMVIVEILEA